MLCPVNAQAKKQVLARAGVIVRLGRPFQARVFLLMDALLAA
jgi:hypothetical protein